MKKTAVLLLLAGLLVAGASALSADPSFYGMSGLIETPDDQIVGTANVALTANYVSDIDNSDSNLITYGGAVGVFPKLELSAVGVDSNADGVGTNVVVNGKYRLLGESVAWPSVVVGVADAFDQLDDVNPKISDPSAFIVFGKNLTSAVNGLGGISCSPLRGTLGFGSGLYKGVFAGVNWSVTSKLDVMLEYLSNGIRQKDTANAGIRYRVYGPLSFEVGTHAFNSVYFGGNFNLSTF